MLGVGSGANDVATALSAATGGWLLTEVTADALAGEDVAAGTLPVVLVVGGEVAPSIAQLLLVQEAARTARRRVRVSMVVLLPCSAASRDALDGALGEDGRPLVDAVMFVSTPSAQVAATSVEAWLRLRHDAPSAAFGDLRDSSGHSCRYATVTATVADSSAPTGRITGRCGSQQRAEHAVEQGLAELAEQVASAGDGRDEMLPPDQLDELVDRATEQLLARLAGCAGATLLVAAEQLASETTPVGESAVTEARLALARDAAALDAESSRSGFAARIGRRKRLEPLTTAVASSEQALIAAVAVADQRAAVAAARAGCWRHCAPPPRPLMRRTARRVRPPWPRPGRRG